MDIGLALMTGIDIPIEALQLTLHQPTIKEISYLGEEEFFTALHYLCLKKEQLVQDETLLSVLTNFQVFMKVLEQPEAKEQKVVIKALLQMLFVDCGVAFTPNSILFVDKETKNTVIIDDSNYDMLQNSIAEVLCLKKIFSDGEVTYNPGNARAKEIADKIMAGRRKLAAIKSKGKKESILSRYLSILTIAIQSMSLQDCINLTLYQLFDLVDRYTLYNEWNIDLQVRLAGGKPDSEPENWMKDIH